MASKGYNDTLPQPVLLETSIVFGQDKHVVRVRQGDDPSVVARAFALEHKLHPKAAEALTAQLEANLRRVAENTTAVHQGSPEGKLHDRPDCTYEGNGIPSGPTGPAPMLKPPVPIVSGHPLGSAGLSAPGNGSEGGQPPVASAGAMDPEARLAAKLMSGAEYQQASSGLMEHGRGTAGPNGVTWLNAGEELTAPKGRAGGGVRKEGAGSMSGLGLRGSLARSSAIGPGPACGGPTSARGGVTSVRTSSEHSVRLYDNAQKRQARLEARRAAEARAHGEELRAARASSHMTDISRAIMRGRRPGQGQGSYGGMLYEEGLEAQRERQRRAEAERKEREDSELQGATFRPEITRLARKMQLQQHSRQGSGGQGVGGTADDAKWARLSTTAFRKSTLDSMEAIRADREAAEAAECTFQPKINSKSKQIMEFRTSVCQALRISATDLLYDNHRRCQKELEEERQQCPEGVTFKPQVNSHAKAQVMARRGLEKQLARASCSASLISLLQQDADPMTLPVEERLYALAKAREEKARAAWEEQYGPVDPNTGRRRHQPEVGRGPRVGAVGVGGRSPGVSVGEHLYARARDQAERWKAREEAERCAAEEEAARSKMKPGSQAIVAETQAKRFKLIFEILAQDGRELLDLCGQLARSPRGRSHSGGGDGGGSEGGGGDGGGNGGGEGPGAPHPPRAPAMVDELEPEVRVDLELAAQLWRDDWDRRHMSSDQWGPDDASAGNGVDQPRWPAHPPPLKLPDFLALMRRVLALHRVPRAYLCPSPPVAGKDKNATFRPDINPRSRAMASRVRPRDVPVHELLHQVGEQREAKLEARRRDQEGAAMEECTFRPQLNPCTREAHGRALRQAFSEQPHGGGRRSTFAAPAAGIATAAMGGAQDLTTRDLYQAQAAAAASAPQPAVPTIAPPVIATARQQQQPGLVVAAAALQPMPLAGCSAGGDGGSGYWHAEGEQQEGDASVSALLHELQNLQTCIEPCLRKAQPKAACGASW